MYTRPSRPESLRFGDHFERYELAEPRQRRAEMRHKHFHIALSSSTSSQHEVQTRNQLPREISTPKDSKDRVTSDNHSVKAEPAKKENNSKPASSKTRGFPLRKRSTYASPPMLQNMLNGSFDGEIKNGTLEKMYITSARKQMEPGSDDSVVLRTWDSKSDDGPYKTELTWIHLASENITLDDFQIAATSSTGMAPNTQGMILQLMQYVKNELEKKFVFGRFLEPDCILVDSDHAKSRDRSQHAIFLAYPYKVLEELERPSKKEAKLSNVHPPRSILQTNHRLDSMEKRDQKQVVRRAVCTDAPHKKLLVVRQFWALLVNDNILVTCSNESQAHMCGDFIKREPTPQFDSGKIRLIDPKGNYREFDMEMCRTWFQLQSVLKQLSVLEAWDYEAHGSLETTSGEQINDSNWAQILAAANGSTLEVNSRYEFGANQLEFEQHHAKSHQPSIQQSRMRQNSGVFLQGETVLYRLQQKGKQKSFHRSANDYETYPDELLVTRTPMAQRQNPFETTNFPAEENNGTLFLRGVPSQNPLGYYNDYDGAHDSRDENQKSDKIYYNVESDNEKADAKREETVNKQSERSMQQEANGMSGETLKAGSTASNSVIGEHSESAREQAEDGLPKLCKPKVSPVTTWKLGQKNTHSPHLTRAGADAEVTQQILEQTHVHFTTANLELLRPYEKAAFQTYRDMPAKTKSDYENALEGLKGWVRKRQPEGYKVLFESEEDKKKGAFALAKLDVLVDAFKIFSLYAPTDYSSETHGKFWAALKQISDLSPTDARLQLVEMLKRELKEQVRLVNKIDNGVRTEDSSQPFHYSIPRELVEAFRTFLVLTMLCAHTLEKLCTEDAKITATELAATSSKGSVSGAAGSPKSDSGTDQGENSYDSSPQIVGFTPVARSRRQSIAAPIQSFLLRGGTPTVDEAEKLKQERQDELDAHVHHIERLSRKALKQMNKGTNQLIMMVHTDYQPRPTYGPVMLPEIVLMFISRLSEHCSFQGTEHANIIEMYNAYATKLHLEVQEHPRKRLLTDINYFASELEPVQRLYRQQKFVLTEFLYLTDTVFNKKKLNELFKESSKGSPKRSFEANIPSLEPQIDGIIFKILNRMEELEEIQGHANHLRQQTIELVDFKNEDQGKAVFVFTVVTVIFLPLSFVTSYFGMNTKDIRDMDREQPTFWAVALPVTLVTLAVSSVVAYWGWLNESVENWRNDRRRKAEAQLKSAAIEERGALSSYNNALFQD